MKTNTTPLFLFLLFLLFNSHFLKANNPQLDSLSFEQLYVDFKVEQAEFAAEFQQKFRLLNNELEQLNFHLNAQNKRKKKAHIQYLENKLLWQEKFAELQVLEETESIKLRYRKGIDLIKLLYEKLLGLDHHFTGMQTFQNIMTLSNPHSYPAFREAKEVFEKKKNKKYNVPLPSLLQTNPFMSAAHLLVSSFLGSGSTQEKENDFEKISCIIDFTVRMNADLSVIQNETEFLKQANKTLKEECERLFAEYTKVIGYLVPIEKCRANDDWESLYAALNQFGAPTNTPSNDPYNNQQGGNTYGNTNTNTGYGNGYGNNPPLPNGGMTRDLVNLEFATQRVADFILKYSSFITRGTQYYQKFDNIVSTYENEKTCQESLPRQFTELKFDIKTTIEKFNNTYNLPEIQGSRLKDLMYGQVAVSN